MRTRRSVSRSIPWAMRVLEGSLVRNYLASAEDDVVTLAPLPGATAGSMSFGYEHPQSGACCPSGSCCASGSCCQSGSACVTVDEDTRYGRGKHLPGDIVFSRGQAPIRQKRLWPIPV